MKSVKIYYKKDCAINSLGKNVGKTSSKNTFTVQMSTLRKKRKMTKIRKRIKGIERKIKRDSLQSIYHLNTVSYSSIHIRDRK
jgi:hypothetical protein